MNTTSLTTEVQPRWKSCLKGAQRAERLAACFTVAFLVMVFGFRGTGGPVAGWLAAVTAWGVIISIFSGVVCLVSAGLEFALLHRQNTTTDWDMLSGDNTAF